MKRRKYFSEYAVYAAFPDGTRIYVERHYVLSRSYFTLYYEHLSTNR